MNVAEDDQSENRCRRQRHFLKLGEQRFRTPATPAYAEQSIWGRAVDTRE